MKITVEHDNPSVVEGILAAVAAYLADYRFHNSKPEDMAELIPEPLTELPNEQVTEPMDEPITEQEYPKYILWHAVVMRYWDSNNNTGEEFIRNWKPESVPYAITLRDHEPITRERAVEIIGEAAVSAPRVGTK